MTGIRLAEVQALVARVQRLADTPRPEAGYPLAWQVEAYYLGDVSALAAAALRAAKDD